MCCRKLAKYLQSTVYSLCLLLLTIKSSDAHNGIHENKCTENEIENNVSSVVDNPASFEGILCGGSDI
jgi:hypothetical protein